MKIRIPMILVAASLALSSWGLAQPIHPRRHRLPVQICGRTTTGIRIAITPKSPQSS